MILFRLLPLLNDISVKNSAVFGSQKVFSVLLPLICGFQNEKTAGENFSGGKSVNKC